MVSLYETFIYEVLSRHLYLLFVAKWLIGNVGSFLEDNSGEILEA